MARPGPSTKKYRKNTPGPKVWTPRKYPKIPLGVPEFRPEGCFYSAFFEEFRVGPSQGSVAGRGVLNINRGTKKHINIHKFPGSSRDWVGGKIMVMCFFLCRSLWRRKAHKQNAPENPGTCLCVFFHSQLKTTPIPNKMVHMA